MAASATVVKQHLSLIERTKVQVESINVEPLALVNCFAHLLEREELQRSGTMFIDLGHSCSKVVITHGANIVFCRTIGIGAEQMVRAICDQLSTSYAEAAHLYLSYYRKNSLSEQPVKSETSSLEQAVEQEMVSMTATAGPGAATLTESEAIVGGREQRVQEVIILSRRNLSEELRSCVRYHDLMFSGGPVGRVIFLGGQAKNKFLCQQLARVLGLPAQLGDPLARINPKTLTGRHSDLESSERHCDWAVAFGLSLGGIQAK